MPKKTRPPLSQGMRDLYSVFNIATATIGIIDQLQEGTGDSDLKRLNKKLAASFALIVDYCQKKVREEWHIWEHELTKRDVQSYTYVLGEMCETSEDERAQVEAYIANMVENRPKDAK